MSYNFDPLSDEQLDAFSLIEDGVYDFEVAKSTRKTSKQGNPMAELQLKVWDKEGGVHIIFDYLVFSKVNLNIKKVSHFCKAVGLEEEYKKGSIPEELECYTGKCEIGKREAQPKPDGGMYPAKNEVKDYIPKSMDGMKPLPEVSDGFDDSIPF